MMNSYNEIFKSNVERLSDTQRMFADQANNVFQTAFASTAKLVELQSAYAQGSFLRKLGWFEEAKELKKEQDLLDFQKKVYQSETQHFLTESKEVTEVLFEAQEQIEKVAAKNFADVNNWISDSLRAMTGSSSSPVALMVKQGIDSQRDAFDKVLAVTRHNWEQGFSQIREAAEKGAEQVHQAQSTVTKATGKRRRA